MSGKSLGNSWTHTVFTVVMWILAVLMVMPFVIGFTVGTSGTDKVFENAFGCVAMIAMMPLIVIQLMGLYAVLKRRAIDRKVRERFIEADDCQIIELAR